MGDFADPGDLVEMIWQASSTGRVDDVPTGVERALDQGHYLSAAEMAICLAESGHEAEAVPLLEATVAGAEASGAVTAEEIFTMRRRMTLDSAWNLGEVLMESGRVDEAVPILRRTVDGNAEVYGERNPHTLRARATYVDALDRSGQREEATRIAAGLVDDLHDTLGADHPLARAIIASMSFPF